MRLASALIHKVLTQMQIPLLTRHSIQFDQREFDFFMSRVTAFLTWLGTEDGVDVIYIATHGIQQSTFARGLEMSHSRFNEMASTIQLMPITQVRPALLWFNNGEIGIEIPIRLLGS